MKRILKTNNFAYMVYSYLFSLIIKIIGLFVKVDDKMILFNSFGGQKFDDSPKVIFDYIKSNSKYKDYKIYWTFDEPEKFEVVGAEKIKNNSIKFFIIALKSKFWITNSGIERGLVFKKKETIYINTWHGTALKHIGKEENNALINYRRSKNDYMYAQSDYDIEIFSRVFDIDKNLIYKVGLPRNDELFNIFEIDIKKIKNKLKLPENKKIILYAPTFREYNRDSKGNFLAPPIDLKKWEEKLKDEYILLFRAHYFVNKSLNIKDSDFVKDVSTYKNLNELMKISDLLISDYSSIMIDYSILERPIFNYVYDYQEYKEKRGMYFDLKDKMPNNCFSTEEDLLNKILNYDEEAEIKNTKKFKNEFVQAGGESKKIIDLIIGDNNGKKD